MGRLFVGVKPANVRVYGLEETLMCVLVRNGKHFPSTQVHREKERERKRKRRVNEKKEKRDDEKKRSDLADRPNCTLAHGCGVVASLF